MPAWPTHRSWTPNSALRFAAFVASAPQPGAFAGLTKFTCEDLALALLIEFASRYGLPLRIANGTGVHRSSAADMRSVAQYRDRVLATTGARDLSRDENTVAVAPEVSPGSVAALMRASPGDLLLLGRDYFHVQVVRSASPRRVEIVQGNFETACGGETPRQWASLITDGEGHPRGICYAGTPIQRGVYDLAAGVYTREQVELPVQKAFEPGSAVRRWNFNALSAG
jgi:hypothetical protein